MSQGVIFEFLWPTASIANIREAFFSLDFSYLWCCQVKEIDSYKLFLVSLSQIWLAHMRFICNQFPFSHTVILVSIQLNIHKMTDEDQCHFFRHSISTDFLYPPFSYINFFFLVYCYYPFYIFVDFSSFFILIYFLKCQHLHCAAPASWIKSTFLVLHGAINRTIFFKKINTYIKL